MTVRVLVVDDEQDIRDALVDFFNSIGYEVTAVAGGTDAVEEVRHRRFDVVMTDLRMPGLDGLETVAALRELDEALRFIIATGHATQSVEAECLQAGVTRVLSKPFDLDEIQRTIEKLIEIKRPPQETKAGSFCVDTATFTDTTNFAEWVREILLGIGGVGSRPGDRLPVDWLVRAYSELQGSPYVDVVTRGVADALTAPEVAVRAQALLFFQTYPQAAGGERIDELVAGDRVLFVDIADPVHPGTDLQWQLLAALAARVRLGNRRSIDLARESAVLPGQAAPLIAELVVADSDWVIAHLEHVVLRTPTAGATILIQLQGSGRDLVTIGRRVAPWCREDARFELDVSRFIDDPETKRQILEAFHSRA